MTPDERDLLLLNLVPGLGPRLTTFLLERFRTATGVLAATAEQLQSVPYIGPKVATEIARARQQYDVDDEIQLLGQHQVALLRLGTEAYPVALGNIGDAPHLLYMGGALEARDARAVAIVGSRQCTPYGKRVTEQLAKGLVQAGYTVVSGLARGIDGVAHKAALEAGGRTVAVLAGGLSRIYPPEHKELAARVRGQGALLTEANMRMDPLAGMFPARNRLISGLSLGVVIVEAHHKSGALITARHAAEQNRTVFAVPGPVDSSASDGPNDLLRQGAILTRGVEDILEELEGVAAAMAVEKAAAQPAAPAGPPPGLDDVQRLVWEFLGGQPRLLDEVAQNLGLTVPQLSSALLMMEMKKHVRRLPGNRFERC